VTRGGELLASGYTIHACVSTKTNRPLRVPPYLAAFVAESTPRRPEA
jgi:acyl-CoA thioesterase FadM